jgi:glycosyltransferase involved in cell wall biosynthesis/peptidoglycan/xylan/chitin deacetylase (PgdA/CDA1 family)
MSQEAITVLLPVHDQRPEFFEVAVRSVLEQTSSQWRLLVGLDRSPDWIEHWLHSLAEPRISLVPCPRRGLAAVLNTLMEAAETDFVCILLSDDRLEPQALETVLRFRRKFPNVDFFHSSRREMDADGEWTGPVAPACETVAVPHFVEHGSPVKHLMCWRRSLGLEHGGMREHLSVHGCDDYDFPWRLAEAGASFKAIPDCLYAYRVHNVGPRLTTDTPIQAQVDALQQMFRDHGVAESEVAAYLDRAVEGYLPREYAGLAPNGEPVLSTVRHREAGSGAIEAFRSRGFARRHFFPHRVHLVHRAGPDGANYARRMLGIRDPAALSELILYGLPPVTDEFPRSLFFDSDVVWHQQHLGTGGQVAHADLVQMGDRLYVTLAQSDLVQRIGRLRRWKTRVESVFKGWDHLLLNAALNVAIDRGSRFVYWPTSQLVLAHCDPTRIVDAKLFERIYDRTAQVRVDAERDGDWWRIDVEANEGRIPLLRRGLWTAERKKVVAICHDVERGLGHLVDEPEFVEEAERASPAALAQMLSVESDLGVHATYNVVGQLVPELRADIEGGGHALAFHSFDHVAEPKRTPGRRLRQWVSGLRPGRRHLDGPYPIQLALCRQVDYRVKGYRPPLSRIPRSLSDANLREFNFEWLASSTYSLGLEEPRLVNGIVKIPIHLDDFPLHTGELAYAEWERRLLDLVEERDFVAVGLHDCYGPTWLPQYGSLLKKLDALAHLETFDSVAARVLLENGTWR